jgi:hypothetical protein
MAPPKKSKGSKPNTSSSVETNLPVSSSVYGPDSLVTAPFLHHTEYEVADFCYYHVSLEKPAPINEPKGKSRRTSSPAQEETQDAGPVNESDDESGAGASNPVKIKGKSTAADEHAISAKDLFDALEAIYTC